MPLRPRLFGAVAIAALLASGPALARPGHHHHRSAYGRSAAGLASGGYAAAYPPQAYGGYYGSAGWEAAVNARLTAQAYREPGVTLELAPDSKQTATGGPSGGVPGFSGH